MTIKVYSDRIEFNNFTIKNTPTGIDIIGTYRSSNFIFNPFQGVETGYTSGGVVDPGILKNEIDYFPFAATTTNATDNGDLTQSRSYVSGQSSGISGYTSGGGGLPVPAGSDSNVIDKFPFSKVGNATNVGNLSTTRTMTSGQSSSTNGFTAGGYRSAGVPVATEVAVIDSFPFATDTNGSNVGSITDSRKRTIGHSSTLNGYRSGGAVSASYDNIDKFSFQTSITATSVGLLTQSRDLGAGISSEDFGYSAGGQSVPVPVSGVIDKFSFVNDSNASSVGSLSVSRLGAAGQSSKTFGYSSGGYNTPLGTNNIIDRFPFSSDAGATDVGDLTVARYSVAGTQR